jgi:regulator of replication initiation timing
LEKAQNQWADDLYNAKVTIDELFDENQELKKDNEVLRMKLKVKVRSGSF